MIAHDGRAAAVVVVAVVVVVVVVVAVVVDGPMAQVHWERHQPRHVHNLWRALGHSLGVHTYFRSNRHAPPRCPTPAATSSRHHLSIS
jgi:hypothetical protein